MSSLVSERSNTGIIEGVILDGDNTNKPLVFAEVQVKNTNISSTTDVNGAFNFKLKPGTYTLIINFIGYKTIETNAFVVTSNNSIRLNQVLSGLTLQQDFSSPITVSQN